MYIRGWDVGIEAVPWFQHVICWELSWSKMAARSHGALTQVDGVGVWTAEAWTAEDASSDVDAPNLDYKRTNNVDI